MREAQKASCHAVWLLGVAGLVFLDACGARPGRQPGSSPARSELFAALGPARFCEGRVTGGLAYAPYRRGAAGRKLSVRLARAVALAEGKEANSPGVAALADLAIVKLLAGKPERAVQNLELAAERAPRDARVLADLSSAHQARAERDDDPSSLVLALAAADRAVKADSGLVEARFNLALSLEKLFLLPAARVAWEAYLRLDPRSGWAGEARARLAGLPEPAAALRWRKQLPALLADADHGLAGQVEGVVRQFPEEARAFVENELLARWALAESKHRRVEALRALQSAQSFSQALAKLNGDELVNDGVLAVRRWLAEPGGSGGRLARLAAGHLAYHQGMASYNNFDFHRCQGTLRAASVDLEAGQSPFAAWASLNAAVCEYYLGEYPAALRSLAALQQQYARSRYPALRGRILWMIALIHYVQADATRSLELYRSALAVFASTGETQNVGALYNLIAENLDFLGDERETWRVRRLALRLTPRFSEWRRLYAIFVTSGEAAWRMNQPAAAIRFQDEAVRCARQWGQAAAISEALWWRASMHRELEEWRAARDDLTRSQEFALRIPRSPLRQRVEADIAIARGELELRTDPAAAAKEITAGLETHRTARYRLRLAHAYLIRARAHLAAGGRERAEADLAAAIAEIDNQRTALGDERFRISFLEQWESLFAEMVAFEIGHGREDLAFDFAEQSRARALLDLVGVAAPAGAAEKSWRGKAAMARPMTAAAIRASLPESVTLVEYAMLRDRLLVWLVTRDGLRLVPVAIPAHEIGLRVARLIDDLREEREPDVVRTSSGELAQALFAPIRPFLRRGSTIVFIPDQVLNDVPFGALFDAAAGAFLVEELRLTVAPSATMFVRLLSRAARAPRAGSETWLVVGNPAFDQKLFPSFRPLPGSEREATGIAALFSGRATLLTGAQATKAAVLERLGASGAVHLGVHAQANRDSPLLSKILLAPGKDGGDSGALTAYELYARPMPATRLVVLAACSTATGRLAKGEGVLSLARPFLAAGVPAVIASLWQVDDAAAEELMRLFYQRLRGGDDALTALGAAQRSLLTLAPRSGRTQASWAAFQFIGAAPPAEGRQRKLPELRH